MGYFLKYHLHLYGTLTDMLVCDIADVASNTCVFCLNKLLLDLFLITVFVTVNAMYISHVTRSLYK